jgi:hypothetical protein
MEDVDVPGQGRLADREDEAVYSAGANKIAFKSGSTSVDRAQ